MKKQLFLKSVFAVFSTVVGLNMFAVAIARPSVPISFIVVNVGSQDGLSGAEFRVPDTNTTVNAGGGLRHYDVHIAKMFEITHYSCQEARHNGYEFNGYSWNYLADNGAIDMGRFPMTCRLAQDIATAYGLGSPERTEITYYRADAVENIPILNIIGGKVERWRQFTHNFVPR
jgi:serine/threonine-protein kinase